MSWSQEMIALRGEIAADEKHAVVAVAKNEAVAHDGAQHDEARSALLDLAGAQIPVDE